MQAQTEPTSAPLSSTLKDRLYDCLPAGRYALSGLLRLVDVVETEAVPTAAVLKILVGHLWRTYVLEEPLELVAAHASASDAQGGGVVEDVGDDEPPAGTAPAPAPA